ncbi:hypothetical protein LEP1GSC188_1496 [Leptospira weilii serovar Topaz str. LT2116]|uniref:Uncharacterized protein n=4 Tax=Leptospira weilii TaxID=28184 RepID=M3GS64_9LEPT|nr:hypothetical protein LEP1GSC036_1494 [Leptospira weilii str. 2006001853]EMF79756.1 hypothetical protein LEP1GSC188_1496 [Leptospira weilii serovar Topaz str. LT2116]EMJ63592.1 hypothetical protein LEP1GSC051_1213 [Leptospira sp. P2653]EMN45969.1 hypothetical protein LEP1GSC086_2243 [Leptospira weilii str. LNT 1234]EMN91788.1 hypothetical protein LEP1GSC108_1776 [Leptospira weilii str. UI 13098]EMY11942.1 hypothetical protein LEP1GSC043_1295 [Leptospira weilii str. Ecochallenge]
MKIFSFKGHRKKLNSQKTRQKSDSNFVFLLKNKIQTATEVTGQPWK